MARNTRRSRFAWVTLLTLLLLAALPVSGLAEPPMGPPKEIDTRTLPVEQSLVCQCGCTMAVAVCDCGTADEFRKEIRTMMDQGQSNDAILASYVAKYGEKVLTAPTKRGFNLTAWIMPFVALALGAVLLMTLLRRWSRAYQASPAAAAAAEAPLTVEEEALYESTVADLLKDNF